MNVAKENSFTKIGKKPSVEDKEYDAQTSSLLHVLTK